jgi:hypothetical protein
MHVQRASVAPAQSFTMQRQSADAPRCPSSNHTSAQAAPISHNLASASAVDAGGRALRKRQVDVGSSELEGFKKLFQVFSLTQWHVTPDGNCKPLSAAESTLWQDMSGGNERKEISKASARPGPKKYCKERSLTWSSTLKTSRGFS